MPLTTRAVSPVNLSLHCLNSSVQKDELQCVANGTIANLIRQLGSLNQNAKQLFSNVYKELLEINQKTSTIFVRVDRLTQKVFQSDFTRNESASLEENHLRKAFKSTSIIDQHTLDRQTLPQALQTLYQKCDSPPDLNQLNPYRDDPKSALSYYTDPSYFFDLWRQEMLKDIGRGGRTARILPPDNDSVKKSLTHEQQKQKMAQSTSHQQSNYLYQHFNNSISKQNVFPNDYTANNNSINISNDEYRTEKHRNGINTTNNAQRLHFPVEYQAPQHTMMQLNNQIQAPPGMSIHPHESKLIVPIQQNTNFANQQNFLKKLNDNASNFVVQQNSTMTDNAFSTKTKENEKFTTDTDSKTLEKKFKDINLTLKSSNEETIHQSLKFDGFLEQDEDDELPPPPPVLSSHTMLSTTTNSGTSFYKGYKGVEVENQNLSETMQFVSSGITVETLNDVTEAKNRLDVKQKEEESTTDKKMLNLNVPTPPPPNFILQTTRLTQGISGAGSFASNTINKDDNSNSDTNKSNNISFEKSGVLRSNLLVEIRSGHKLRKTQKKEEDAESKTVKTLENSQNVAEILRRRMESLFGNDESSESNNSDDNSDWY